MREATPSHEGDARSKSGAHQIEEAKFLWKFSKNRFFFEHSDAGPARGLGGQSPGILEGACEQKTEIELKSLILAQIER